MFVLSITHNKRLNMLNQRGFLILFNELYVNIWYSISGIRYPTFEKPDNSRLSLQILPRHNAEFLHGLTGAHKSLEWQPSDRIF
jgi:hypothetical protein